MKGEKSCFESKTTLRDGAIAAQQ